MHATTQVATEATKTAVIAAREAETLVNNVRPTGSPTLKQPIFDWKAPDKYHELCNFETKVKNIFSNK